MIILTEKKSVKIPSVTSLFVELTYYSKEIFDFLIQIQEVHYNAKSKVFEVPINKLSFIVKFLTKYSDVKIIPMDDSVNESVKVSSKNFKVKPYSHQIDAINYGLSHKGWMLLDDCGLGKTISMIYLAEELKRREKIEHCLIICGVNSLKYNWDSEIKKFSKLDSTILGSRINRNGKTVIGSVKERCAVLEKKIKEFFVITNIETLQSKDFIKSLLKSPNKFDMVVLDEAHKCKDPSSISGKNLLKIKAKRCIALTGTLIMNNPENAYVPLKWTENTSSTYTDFKRMFNVYGGFNNVQVIGHKNLNILQDLIANCSLRRLKESVLDLPDKTYKIEYVEMGKKQKDLYDEVSQGIAVELDKLDHIPTVMEELAINARLRQITAFPGMLSTEITQSAKIDRAEELVQSITGQGDKVVLFCTYKGCAEELYSKLHQYSPVICTGDYDDVTISNSKKIFEEDEACKVMICTWQKMGTGHTLTKANYAIFIDTPWTDADFQQAADRIYRIGQNKKVFIITLITKDSYDERVQEILEKKECLSGYLVDNKESNKLNIFGE